MKRVLLAVVATIVAFASFGCGSEEIRYTIHDEDPVARNCGGQPGGDGQPGGANCDHPDSRAPRKDRSAVFPGRYMCLRDSIGNYVLFRLNDDKVLDAASGSLEWCAQRIPTEYQEYYCMRTHAGFVVAQLLDGRVLSQSASSIEGCLRSLPR